MPDTRPLKVFLCHASADKVAVRKLYQYLRERKMDPWLDAEKLLPGQNWKVEIPKALDSSDAIIICLSKNSVDKEGYVQKEIKFALDKALEMPEGRIYLIPARLEECDIPESLKSYHWVNLFEKNWNRKLMQSLNERAVQLGLTNARLNPEEVQPPVITSKIKNVLAVRPPSEHDGHSRLMPEQQESGLITSDHNLDVQSSIGGKEVKLKEEKFEQKPVEKKGGFSSHLPVVEWIRVRSKPALKFDSRKIVIISFLGIVLLIAEFLFYKISQIQTSFPPTVVITTTPFPTLQAEYFYAEVPEGANAQITFPDGNITPLVSGQALVTTGTQIDVLSGVIPIDLRDGSVLYLAEGTSLKFVSIMYQDSTYKEAILSLNKGAVMVNVLPGSSIVIQTYDGIIVRAGVGFSNSIMGVQLGENHYVDCYEGQCSISGNIPIPIDSMAVDGRYLEVTASQILISSITDRCQAWESALGLIFNQLDIQACIIPTMPTQ